MRMIYITVLFSALMLTSCASGGVPDGSVAWCGNFEYTGTWVKAETDGRALGVSDSAVVDRMTVQDVIALAESMGCNRE